jgi:hypothetical protein
VVVSDVVEDVDVPVIDDAVELDDESDASDPVLPDVPSSSPVRVAGHPRSTSSGRQARLVRDVEGRTIIRRHVRMLPNFR